MQPAPASQLSDDAPPNAAAALPWCRADIDFAAIDAERVRGDETLFFMLATASFVEIASDVYTGNLSRFYGDDPEVVTWLRRNWEQEELQHGQTLRDYVRAVWPEFDWDAANADFFADYAARCTVDEFEPSQALEMAARCVVETGTACYYRMLHDYGGEPVLKCITDRIRTDEVRHYRHFLRFFLKYADRDRASRWQVARAVIRRILEVRDDDGLTAFRHAFRLRYPGRSFQQEDYNRYRSEVKAVMRRHFPRAMAVKMLLKPMRLPAALQRLLLPVLTRMFVLAFV